MQQYQCKWLQNIVWYLLSCVINVYKLTILLILTSSKLVGANYKFYCINCVVRDIYFITAIHIDYIIYCVNDSVGVQTGGMMQDTNTTTTTTITRTTTTTPTIHTITILPLLLYYFKTSTSRHANYRPLILPIISQYHTNFMISRCISRIPNTFPTRPPTGGRAAAGTAVGNRVDVGSS